MEELTDNQFIQKQGIFDTLAIQQLRNQINSENPGEAASRMWAIIVFQQWWIKNFS